MQAFCHFMAFWHFCQKANCITKSAFSRLFHWIRLLDFPALFMTVALQYIPFQLHETETQCRTGCNINDYVILHDFEEKWYKIHLLFGSSISSQASNENLSWYVPVTERKHVLLNYSFKWDWGKPYFGCLLSKVPKFMEPGSLDNPLILNLLFLDISVTNSL